MKKTLYICILLLASNAFAERGSAQDEIVVDAPVIIIEEVVGDSEDEKIPKIVRPILGNFDAGDIPSYKVVGGVKITSGFYTPENSDDEDITFGEQALKVEIEQSDDNLYFAAVNYAKEGEFYTNITTYDQAKKACESLGQGWELLRSKDMFSLAFLGILSELEGLQNLYLGDEEPVIVIPAVPDSSEDLSGNEEVVEVPLKAPVEVEDFMNDEKDYTDLSTMYGNFTPFWFAPSEWNDPTGTDNLQLFRQSGWDPSPVVSLSDFMEKLSASEKEDPGSLKSAYHRVALETLKSLGVPAICSNGSLQD